MWTVPSSFAIGWSPCSRSMIESRRAARPTPPSRNTPSESGPRCTSVALISASRPGSTGAPVDAIPQIPHTDSYSRAVTFSRHDELILLGLLAAGLVAGTMCAVAVIAHEAVGLAWAPAFVLGAVVAPTDPIAATSIARRLGVPRRVVTIVEGESLVNDATALVLYRAAVVAAVAGTFSFADASLRFLAGVAVGTAVGLAVGWIVALVRIRLDNIPAEIAISLLTGYLAYIPAQALHV